ncbi:MAG: SDR family NAD(P)-dependent oxidoreductase [Pirellulales bacterium]
MPKRTLHDARVVLTGASSGIGRDLAKLLCEGGANVIAVARRQSMLDDLADECVGARGRLYTLVGDVTVDDVRTRAMSTADEVLGGLDLLINNAGVGAIGAFADANEARLRQVMEVNFFAASQWTRDALPLLRRGRLPMIVNIGSILGYRAIGNSSEYCSSKFAIRGLSQALRAELQPQGVHVLHVAPGPTETDFFDHLVEQRGEAAWRGRPKTPASIVARRIIRAIENDRRESIPSVSGWFYCLADRIAPSVVDWAIRRMS